MGPESFYGGESLTPPDRRINEIADWLRQRNPLDHISTQPVRDPLRTIAPHSSLMGHAQTNLVLGYIVHAIPSANWYRVQAMEGMGTFGACRLSGNLAPLGVRDSDMLAPGNCVLVWQPYGAPSAVILGVLPRPIFDGRVVNPDWIVQGGQAGLKRSPAHQFPMTAALQQGPVTDWSNNRPMDETALGSGKFTSTGVGWYLDDNLIFMRVHEMCGFWATLADGFARLAGQQLLVETPVHQEFSGDDEGESHLRRGYAVYPWEGLGAYAPGTSLFQQNSPQAVQYAEPLSTTDLPDSSRDLQPVHRWQEFSGYLGQGHFRALYAPSATSGVRRRSDQTVNTGLFCESVGLDGSYNLAFAKSGIIGKRSRIIVPKQLRDPEDGLGDDARAGNYKASGYYGDGPEHVIADVKTTSAQAHLQRVASALDFAAYCMNWKGLHPFHYHSLDFFTPQENAATAMPKVQEFVDYAGLTTSDILAPPSPLPQKIDLRYGDVQFFQRESFIIWHDDGSVQLGCGYGAGLIFTAGLAQLEAPAGIRLVTGGQVTLMAKQVVVEAEAAVDISSATGSLRLKADTDIQVLAGNSGIGSLVLESRGSGVAQNYHNLVGDDVAASGIVLKAAGSTIGLLGQNLYLRGGGNSLGGGGNIVIDAGAGSGNVAVTAAQFECFLTGSAAHYLLDAEGNVQQAYSFAAEQCTIGADLVITSGGLSVVAGDIELDGNIRASQSISAGAVVASGQGMYLGQVPGSFVGQVQLDMAALLGEAADLLEVGSAQYASDVVDVYYGDGQLGADQLEADIGFSFRDDLLGTQYGAAGTVWLEARFQQLGRLGLATAGRPWQENGMVYQGQVLYPWPGRNNWQNNPVFQRLTELKFFDAETGCSADRPYLDPTYAELTAVPMSQGLTVLGD